MSQAQTKPCVLIVGRAAALDGGVRNVLERSDLEPVWHASAADDAFVIARREQPRFIVLDFDLDRGDPDVVADALRVLAPTAWILDFSGLVRRRPEHAHVDLDDTHPLLYVTDHPSGA